MDSPQMLRFVLAVVSGVLLASGHLLGGVITGVIALLLHMAWLKWGAEDLRRRKGSIR
jgi:hypothetical protein